MNPNPGNCNCPKWLATARIRMGSKEIEPLPSVSSSALPRLPTLAVLGSVDFREYVTVTKHEFETYCVMHL